MGKSLKTFHLMIRDTANGTPYEPTFLHGSDADTLYECAKSYGITVEDTEAKFLTRFSRAINPYPINSIYISSNSTSPASYFGGSWERIQDKFLFCAGPEYAAGNIPTGAATVTLTIDTMPSHTHTFAAYNTVSTDPGVSGSYYPGAYSYNQSGTLTSSYTGGDEAHNNIPPYIAKYVWKRVA